MEAAIAGQLSPIKHNQWYEVRASPASDWLRDISGWKLLPLISLDQPKFGLNLCPGL